MPPYLILAFKMQINRVDTYLSVIVALELYIGKIEHLILHLSTIAYQYWAYFNT